jgi:hypothetical protein
MKHGAEMLVPVFRISLEVFMLYFGNKEVVVLVAAYETPGRIFMKL